MIPIVLCGGSGTRLWPVSRAACPKQFVELIDESLLAKTLRRLRSLGEPRVVATAADRSLTHRVLGELAIPGAHAWFEPRGRNTAPAVALACRWLQRTGDGEAVVGIFPADHLVADEAAFLAACALAERCAEDGDVVTLGIRPTSAATGYGYIEAHAEPLARAGALTAHRALAFHEKPASATAERFLAAGNFYWNAGMFVFRVATMAEHFARWMPELWAALGELADDGSNLAEIYDRIAPQSLDYGVMEHLDRQVVIPCAIGWSDLGSWDELAQLAAAGAAPTPPPALFEQAAAGNFVYPYRDKIYGLVGVEELLVVDTADALLIARKGTSQQVKELVAQLKAAGRSEATEHVYEHRPWGGFEILRDTERFKSKILWVDPGQQLSYQSHRRRAEHWVVVQGHPEVVLDGEVLRPQPGEAVYIPLGARHRIRNPGTEIVEIVEVQLGDYFGEDDIVRYEDDYDRV
jgi:mannose-1-phosphate guanylyltransferase/mannose-1-phosphate guanylyltransferase/mannose-6-phosphate isomerase